MTRDDRYEFELERYRFILQEIHFQNENIHKYLSLFQTLTTALIGGGVGLFVSWKGLGISADIARIGIQGLIGGLFIITAFFIVSVLSGIFSWLDYRQEEVELLSNMVGSEFRKKPSIRNFWRWHETYLILFIIVVAIAIYLFVENQIIPLIH